MLMDIIPVGLYALRMVRAVLRYTRQKFCRQIARSGLIVDLGGKGTFTHG
jgi:hypothetical protein